MSKVINLNHITKIEGHAKLALGIKHGKVTKCELSSTEGSRYFEGLVLGRHYNEAHEITSRICGICSCAHVTAAIMAVEDALQYTPTEQTKELRRLMTLGERIRSHATHLYFLSLPDYLGYESALAMAPKYRKELQNALRLIRAGNNIITVIGSRDLHPVSAAVGGWLKFPSQQQVVELKKQLITAKKDAIKTCRLFFSLKYPDFESRAECFSLVGKNRYAILDGWFTSEKVSFNKQQYRRFLQEYQSSSSTANFVVREGHRYMVGALSRLNNNSEYLSKDAKKMLKLALKNKRDKKEKSKNNGLKMTLPSHNPYMNNIAQAIELVHCIDHAIEICCTFEKNGIKDEPIDKIRPRAGTGIAAIEVPRGTLWHEYTINEKGIITKANIITPTAQNLLNIQEDIRQFVPSIINRKKEYIIEQIEKLIRSYDPCFSCSAHFLEVRWV